MFSGLRNEWFVYGVETDKHLATSELASCGLEKLQEKDLFPLYEND